MHLISISIWEEMILGLFAESRRHTAGASLNLQEISAGWRWLRPDAEQMRRSMQTLAEAKVCTAAAPVSGSLERVALTEVGAEYLQICTEYNFRFRLIRRLLHWYLLRHPSVAAAYRAAPEH